MGDEVGLELTGAKVAAAVGEALTGAKVVIGAITGAAVVGASVIGSDDAVVGALVLMETMAVGDAVIFAVEIVGVCK